VSHDVSIDSLSVSQCINMLSDRLEKEQRISLSSCFTFLTKPMTIEEAKQEVVVTFLSVLEMGKLGLIRLVQLESSTDESEEIFIESAVESLKEVLLDKLPSEDDYR
jgi:chromatin segregation and condensation protein Rec8/ScpA/Scc1 (kleisin family)